MQTQGQQEKLKGRLTDVQTCRTDVHAVITSRADVHHRQNAARSDRSDVNRPAESLLIYQTGSQKARGAIVELFGSCARYCIQYCARYYTRQFRSAWATPY